MATSTIFSFNFNNSEIVDSTGQWYDATTGTPTTEFIEHDGNTALLQRAYVAGTAYTRDINPVFFQSRDPTFTAHTYTIELQLYPLRDPGGANFGPESGPVLDFNPDADDEKGWVRLNTGQHGSASNTFYWREYGLGPDSSGVPFLTVTAADGTYNRWYSIRIERVDDGTNTGATIKIYVDGTLVVNETLTYAQDALIGRIGDSIRYTYRRSSIDPQGAGVAIDNFKLTAGIAPSSVVDVSLANLQRNNANLLSFIKGKVPTVNDGTLTIKVNGATAGTFTANQSTAATANITVPTAVSELTNDSGYLTSSSNLDASKLTSGTVDIARLPQGALERLIKVANAAARYALTTADVQLGDTVQQLDTGIMYVVTDTDHLDSAAGYTEYTAGTAASVPWSGVTGKPAFATVATSGSYNDLSNKPTIPTVNNATLTIQRNGTTVKTFTANASSNVTANITVPTNTNELTNGAGFITANYAVPRAGGAVMSGGDLARTVDDAGFHLCGGKDWNKSGSVLLHGGGRGDYLTGAVVIHTFRDVTTKNMHIYPDGTWTWEGQPCQTASDQRLKQQISEIDDALLDAWEDVNPVQFKYNDAVNEKGTKARLHTGFVVQQIDSACKKHSVDISQYGLYCHEEYPERTEEVEVLQKDGTIKKETRVIEEASEHYSLRYTEALIVECKYLRRCIARLTARIEQLEKGKEQEASK